MATLTYTYQMRLIPQPDGSYTWEWPAPVALKDEQTLTNGIEGSNSFQPNEALYDGDGEASGTYIGYVGDAIVVFSAKGNYFINANDPAEIPKTVVPTVAAFPVCFLAGTHIATPVGNASVEDLATGDLVLTADGRTAPVRWVGVQTVVTLFADPLRTFPVRVTAGALGDGLPVRDLLVSPDHALMLDGVLVQAAALVNGTTIVRETAVPERFTYFHVELDDHALILAEGVAAETFVDNVTRRRFDNYAEFEALYGEAGATISEMDVPRVKSARQLPQALRERLAARAAVLRPVASSAA